MNKKMLIGSGFKMRKSVQESIDYTKRINDFINKHVSDVSLIEVFILASFEALYPMSKIISNSKILKLGAQNCWYENRGPYTGEVSPMNLKEIGCTYVEIGHPERRDIFKEDKILINKKIKSCIKNGLKPILFIGEKEKYKDKNQVYKFLEKQLLEELGVLHRGDLNKVVLAYEPIWAIGAQEAAPVNYIQDSLFFLRKFFESKYGKDISENQIIFYGGSVKLENTIDILKIEGNDGISSGRGASNPDYFIDMIKLAIEFMNNKSLKKLC